MTSLVYSLVRSLPGVSMPQQEKPRSMGMRAGDKRKGHTVTSQELPLIV